MSPEVFTFISECIYLDKVGSTNIEARRLLSAGPVRGNVLLIADNQSDGKGRGVNRWWSGDGSLAFTLILNRSVSAHKQLIKIPLVVGLSIQKVLQEFLSEPVRVKWPNDVMVGSKKICGILCESDKDIDGNNRIIVGIGLNVNDSSDGAPEAIRPLITTMYDLLGKEIDKTLLLSQILLGIKKDLHALSCHGFSHFMQSWEISDFLKNRLIEVEDAKTVLAGHALGVTREGLLRLMLRDNSVKEIISGSIKLL